MKSKFLALFMGMVMVFSSIGSITLHAEHAVEMYEIGDYSAGYILAEYADYVEYAVTTPVAMEYIPPVAFSTGVFPNGPNGEPGATWSVNFGVLTIDSGFMNIPNPPVDADGMTLSYWDSFDTVFNRINSIIITGPVTAGESIRGLFSGLTAVNNIVGIDNIDTSNVVDASYIFSGVRGVTSLDLSSWNTNNMRYMRHMFSNYFSAFDQNLTALNLTGWNTHNVVDMSRMFSGLAHITDLDVVSGWDTSNVRYMNSMFSSMPSVSTLDLSNWNTNNVRNMGSMFHSSAFTDVGDISNWNTSNVENMGGMFGNMPNLTSIDLTSWDTANVENMSNMFSMSMSLTNIGDLSNWDTSSVTDMWAMFAGVIGVASIGDLSNWDTRRVTNMHAMFGWTLLLTDIGDLSGWDTSSVTDMAVMFSGIGVASLGDISNWDTSSVTVMLDMFAHADNFVTLDLSGWDTSNVTDMRNMFFGASSLESLYLTNWDTSSLPLMENMFQNATALNRLYLGSNFYFSANAGLTNVPTTAPYMGSWTHVGAVAGSPYFTSGEMMQNAHHTSPAHPATWVWRTPIAAVIDHEVRFRLAGGNVGGIMTDVVHDLPEGQAIGLANVPVPTRTGTFASPIA